jgi:hypothetical protein
MARRVYYSNSSLTTSSTTSATYQNKTSITFTPSANKRYAIFWSAAFTTNSTTNDGRVRLQKTSGTATTFQLFNIELTNTADVVTVQDVSLYTAPASPSSETFAIQFSSEGGASTTISDARIVIVELYDDDYAVTTDTETSTTSDVYSVLDSIEIPFNIEKDRFVVVSSAGISTPSTNQSANSIGIRINNGNEIYSEQTEYFSQDTTNFTPYWAIGEAFSGDTISLEHKRNVSGETLTTGYRTIVAFDILYLSSEDSPTFLGEPVTNNTNTPSTTLSVEYLPFEGFPSGSDLLVLGHWTTTLSGTNVSSNSNFLENTVSQFTQSPTRRPSIAADVFNQGIIYTGSYATEPTFEITHNRAGGQGNLTSTLSNGAITVIDLEYCYCVKGDEFAGAYETSADACAQENAIQESNFLYTDCDDIVYIAEIFGFGDVCENNSPFTGFIRSYDGTVTEYSNGVSVGTATCPTPTPTNTSTPTVTPDKYSNQYID